MANDGVSRDEIYSALERAKKELESFPNPSKEFVLVYIKKEIYDIFEEKRNKENH